MQFPFGKATHKHVYLDLIIQHSERAHCDSHMSHRMTAVANYGGAAASPSILDRGVVVPSWSSTCIQRPALGFVRSRQRRLCERGSRRAKTVRAFLPLRGLASVTSHVRVMLLASFLYAYVESLRANFSPLRCFVATSGEVVSETDGFTIFGR